MHCPNCNTENGSQDLACASCGGSLRVPEAERRPLTVLFCDLVGSTALSLELDPEELTEIVRQYQARCAEIVRLEGGYIAQYLGDGILVYFGYPEAHEDDSRRAARVGLKIAAHVSTLLARGRPLQVRIGIHTGVVVVGPIGTGPTSQRLAVGEAPNIAARVQAQAGLNQVLVTDATRRLIDGYFDFEDIGPRELAGTSKATHLFRVRGETGAMSRLEAARSAGLSPFVGRNFEVGLIMEHLTATSAPGSRVLLIRGEPGVGKSRLLDVVSDQAASLGFQCLRSYCSPQHDNSPLYPVASLFFRWLGARPHSGITTTEVLEALSPAGAAGSDAEGLASSLISIFEGRTLPLPGATPQKRQRFILETIHEWLSRIAMTGPLVLLIEDVHWADPTTLDLIEFFARTPHRAIFPCVSARPEFDGRRVSPADVREVRLGPLSREEVAELVSNVVGRGLPERVTASVYVEADGIPLFVEEVTRARLEAGLFGSADDDLRRAGHPSNIPARLHEPLMARLDRLGSAKQLAQRAAVLGREFSEELLLGFADSNGTAPDAESVRADLARLVAAGIVARLEIASDDGAYTFKHALIRDAAYGSLLRSARQGYHRQAATALSRPARHTEDGVIAMHLEEAGDLAEGAKYWQRSGATALARGATREAIAHLQRALRLMKEIPETAEKLQTELELHLAIAPALMSINGWAARSVEESCQRALELAQILGSSGAALQAVWGLWSVCFVRGDVARALPVAEQLLESARVADNALLTVMAHHAMAFTLYCHGRFAEVRKHAEAGIALFSLDRERIIVQQLQLSSSVILNGLLAAVLWLQGHSAEGEERLQIGARLAEELGHAPSLAVHLSLRADMHLWQHDSKRLLDASEQMLSLAEAEGFELHVPVARYYRGIARGLAGEHSEGISEAGAAAAAYAALGAAMNATHGHCGRAELMVASGRVSEALALLDEAEKAADELGEASCRGELQRVRAEVLASRGDVEGAVATLRRAIEIARSQGAPVLASRAAASLARISKDGRAVHIEGAF
jgi:class 3 adenylate cyclase/tetratricopeptide (TPR) repeat protein